MQVKNVWILNHYAISPDMAGGTRHYDLARQLIKRGYNVTIFASGFDHVTKRYIKIKPNDRVKIEEYKGVRFVWLNTFPYKRNNWRRVVNMISYGVRVLFAARKLPKPDIIIGSSMHPFAVISAWWMSRSYGAKFVFEVRDLWPQTAVDMNAMREKSIPAGFLYIWEKSMYDKADLIIVVLPYAKEYIEKRGIRPNKITWIPNGVDLEHFNESVATRLQPTIAKPFEQNEERFKIMYTGAHGIPNGLDLVIDSAAYIQQVNPECCFVLIGDGSEKKRLKSKAEQLKLSNVIFCEPIPKGMVPSVLSMADCLLFSTPDLAVYKYGISPNKLFDYLASARPIVFAGSPNNNIVDEANAGFVVPPNDYLAFSKALLKVAKMSVSERLKLGANGREYLEKHYSMRVLGDKLDNVLKRIP